MVSSQEFIRWTLGMVDDPHNIHSSFCLLPFCDEDEDENEMNCKIKWNCLVCFFFGCQRAIKFIHLSRAWFRTKDCKNVYDSPREQANKIDVPCKRRYVSEWSCLFLFRANRIYRLRVGFVLCQIDIGLSVFLLVFCLVLRTMVAFLVHSRWFLFCFLLFFWTIAIRLDTLDVDVRTILLFGFDSLSFFFDHLQAFTQPHTPLLACW